MAHFHVHTYNMAHDVEVLTDAIAKSADASKAFDQAQYDLSADGWKLFTTTTDDKLMPIVSYVRGTYPESEFRYITVWKSERLGTVPCTWCWKHAKLAAERGEVATVAAL